MFPWIGAAGSALSLLNTVLKAGTASSTAKTGSDPFSSLGQALTGNSSGQANAVTGSGQGAPTLSSGTLGTLIAMQGQNGANGKGVFARLDADGDGSISKNEFETAAKNAGLDTPSADAVFGKLDANGDGSISKGELAKAMGRHHHHYAGGKGGLSQAMNSDAAGATTKTTSNADGSSTTTVTYQDGSAITMTTPANSASGGANQANLLEKLIKMQAQIANSSSGATASTTA